MTKVKGGFRRVRGNLRLGVFRGGDRFVAFGFQGGDTAQTRLHLTDHVAGGELGERLKVLRRVAVRLFLDPLFLRGFRFVFHGRSLTPDVLRRNSFLTFFSQFVTTC